MKFDIMIMLKKGFLGFIYSLMGVVVMAVVQALSSYKPAVCSAEIIDNCTPQFIVTLYYAIVPTVTGALIAFANYLKNRKNA